MPSIVFWDWLGDSESATRTKRIVDIVFGGLVAARQLAANFATAGLCQVRLAAGLIKESKWAIEKPYCLRTSGLLRPPATTRSILDVGTAWSSPWTSGCATGRVGLGGKGIGPKRNEFNRPHIFSLLDFYHEKDVWLFGGVFRVLARHQDRYDVELTELDKPFIGRLKLRSPYRSRATRVNFENHYDGPHTLRVSEILREPFSGRMFPGYEEVTVSFVELETLLRNNRPDWKA